MPRPSLRHSAAWLCLPAALLMSACTSAEMYRKENPVEPLTSKAGREVKLGCVEVDDMGELQDFRQLTTVTDTILAESKKGSLRLILFVHGWNNNAGPDSRSLNSFKTALQDLQDAQSQDGGGKVFGVFISWRGRTLKHGSPLLDFYHRGQGAHRVGTGAGTDAIFEVAAAAKNANKKNVVILCGHSFGGLLLEDAISQPIRARLAEAHAKGTSSLHSNEILPADMIILINEAQNAIKARQLVSALRDRQVSTADGKDIPWIVSVTSQTDSATGSSFPAGIFVGRYVPPFNFFNTAVSGKYRQDDIAPNAGNQSAAASHTAGHFRPLHSHVVERIGDAPSLSATSDQNAHILANLHPVRNGHILYRCSAGEYEIKRVPATVEPFNTTPYWIMDVPKEIIANHGDIWSARVTGLVTALIHLRTDESVKASLLTPARSKAATATGPMRVELKTIGGK